MVRENIDATIAAEARPRRRSHLWRQAAVDVQQRNERINNESADSFCRMVHSVRTFVAHRATCANSLSRGLAFVFAVAAYRHHAKRGIRISSCLAVSSGTFARVETR